MYDKEREAEIEKQHFETVVRYENEFNKVALKDFTSTDMNLLMYLCHKVREKKTDVVEVDTNTLKKVIGYTKTNSRKEFKAEVEKMNKKLINCYSHLERLTDNGKKEVMMLVLFSTFYLKDDGVLKVRINRDFQYLLNKSSVKWQFTRFSLDEFINLKTKYSKEIYRRLKQFRTQGWWHIEIDEFKRLLNIPETYKMNDITKRILDPSLEELSNCFKNLKLEKIYKNGHGRGGKVVKAFKFTFESETIMSDEEDDEVWGTEDKSILCEFFERAKKDKSSTVRIVSRTSMKDSDVTSVYDYSVEDEIENLANSKTIERR